MIYPEDFLAKGLPVVASRQTVRRPDGRHPDGSRSLALGAVSYYLVLEGSRHHRAKHQRITLLLVLVLSTAVLVTKYL